MSPWSYFSCLAPCPAGWKRGEKGSPADSPPILLPPSGKTGEIYISYLVTAVSIVFFTKKANHNSACLLALGALSTPWRFLKACHWTWNYQEPSPLILISLCTCFVTDLLNHLFQRVILFETFSSKVMNPSWEIFRPCPHRSYFHKNMALSSWHFFQKLVTLCFNYHGRKERCFKISSLAYF